MNIKTFLQLTLLTLLSLTGCAQHGSSEESRLVDALQYSELLEMQELTNGRTLCRIKDPWRTDRTMMQYLLVPETDQTWDEEQATKIQSEFGASTLVRTPLRRMTITSSCHAWLLSQLDALDCVSVLCDTSYVMATNIQTWMRTNKPDGNPQILDGGSSNAPNAEVILAAQSDALWLSPYEKGSFGNLASLPVTIIYCADYMENSPLGRAEWMRFYGRLVGAGNKADALFASISKRYEMQTEQPVKDSLQLLAELPYGSTWYVPGGASTSALLYADAGYRYLWCADTHAGSLALSLEAVVAQAAEADIWLFKYINQEGDWSLDDFLRLNPSFSQIKAARMANVWGCNTARSDFFDITPFRPDTLLGSLLAKDEAFFQRLK